jgi:hypothetical protein
MNTDPFIRKVLKGYSRYYYEEARGYTKHTDIRIGLLNILKFKPHNHEPPKNKKFRTAF